MRACGAALAPQALHALICLLELQEDRDLPSNALPRAHLPHRGYDYKPQAAVFNSVQAYC